jgi:hypothetical protein
MHRDGRRGELGRQVSVRAELATPSSPGSRGGRLSREVSSGLERRLCAAPLALQDGAMPVEPFRAGLGRGKAFQPVLKRLFSGLSHVSLTTCDVPPPTLSEGRRWRNGASGRGGHMGRHLLVGTVVVLLPVAIQAQTINRESIERAVATVPREPILSPLDDRWSEVIKLGAGRQILVAVVGGSTVTGHFVAADASAVVVLNLTAPFLEPGVARVLLNSSAVRPNELAATLTGRDLTVAGHVRLGLRGIFIDDRRIGDLNQVVVRIAREDVDEVRLTGGVSQHTRMWWGGVALLAAGLDVAAVNLYGSAERRPGGTTCYCDGYLGAPGVALGSGLAATGGLLVHRAGRRDGVVYTATSHRR